MDTPASLHVNLSADGPRLSRIVAGAWRMADWQFSVEDRIRWIEQCLELGITTFDHADIYGGYACERLFGEALERAPGLRARMQIVTKCGIKLVSQARPEHRVKSYDTSRAHIAASVENSLRQLASEQIELLLIHRPDPLMAPDEMARAFEHLRAAGQVRWFGVSNFTPSQFATLQRRFPLVTNQIELSPLCLAPRHDGTLDQCLDAGVRPMIWSPLAGGRLFTGDDPAAHRVRSVLEGVARRFGVSVASVAYAWVLRHPSGPLPITGSHRVEALRDAVAALQVSLDAETWHEIWTAGAGHEVP